MAPPGGGGHSSSVRSDRSPTGGDSLIDAVLDGDLARVKDIIGEGRRSSTFFLSKEDGYELLHYAACWGHQNTCKYLVEDLEIDPNTTAVDGLTPLMAAARSDSVYTVKYFLDIGINIMQADEKGFTATPCCVRSSCIAGSCKVTEFLLSNGIPVNVDFGSGSPLFHAALRGQENTVKILLDHQANKTCPYSLFLLLLCNHSQAGANVNGARSTISPLLIAAEKGHCTEFIRLLLKAGADPNIPNDFGKLPIEISASRGCKAEVEMLLPLTSRMPNVVNWTADGVITHVKSANAKALRKANLDHITGTRDKRGINGISSKREPFAQYAKRNVKKLCDMLGSMIQKKVPLARLSDGTIRNSVTLSLNDGPFQVLKSYINAVLHFRLWNFERGTCIDISEFFGYTKRIFTTPPDGTFHFLVKYKKYIIDFVFDGRAAWFHGWAIADEAYEFQLSETGKSYMNHNNLKLLEFTGNYKDVPPDNCAGLIDIGLKSMRDTFMRILLSGGKKSTELMYALGTWVILLGEAPKFHRVFLCCCRAIIDTSIVNLDSFDKSLGLMVRRWAKLCEPVGNYLVHCLAGRWKPDFKAMFDEVSRLEVPGLVSIQDVLNNVCIWTHGSPKGSYFKPKGKGNTLASPIDPYTNDDVIVKSWKKKFPENLEVFEEADNKKKAICAARVGV
ncbi:hypothetical protein PR202_ga24282 [Eleusine coracana subsp. coracana]|uniref:Uncharacterized protein n=1 Tax=Eleusine coracana subsp. coracana TaxID=191504 RepID=A0AAV5D8H4_ELECO|nr:hypothetical protein PR202_ga24282 [Eleusine coracana subsp. coracana]